MHKLQHKKHCGAGGAGGAGGNVGCVRARIKGDGIGANGVKGGGGTSEEQFPDGGNGFGNVKSDDEHD